MGYQSKTWSLSDEVVAVFDRAKAEGVSPNQLLLRVFNLIDDDKEAVEWRRFFDSEMDRHRAERESAPPAKELLVELDEAERG